MWPLPLPPSVSFSIVRGPCDEGALLPEEREELAPVTSTKRRAEYTAGRAAVRAALRAIGTQFADVPVLRGNEGEPLWPAAIVGSLTHSHGVAIAAVALRTEVALLGIDLELIEPGRQAGRDVSSYIASEEEQRWIHEQPEEALLRTRMLFSAKESIYKAFWPLYRKYFGFKQAALIWNSERGEFTARLLFDAAPEYPAGYTFPIRCAQWREDAVTYVFNAVVLPQMHRSDTVRSV